jgi:8-oxo-dGTP diphosphatase
MIKTETAYNYPKHLLAVDCVIFGYEEGKLKLLLCPRSFEPSLGKWSLMGGFVEDKESLEETALRVLDQTTGLKNIFMEQVGGFSEVNRDEAARVISMAFVALIRIDIHDNSLAKENGTYWWPVNRLPDLIFDHKQMVEKALLLLQKHASTELTGKELLPPQFTLLQLRLLYEAIFQRPFDPGNFRKKVLSLNMLEKLNEKNTTESKKGAFYYRFKEVSDPTNGNQIFRIH